MSAAGIGINRRHLQIALGVLWLLDGALQLQPFMFTAAFGHQILGQAADGQPGWVAGPVHFFANHVAQYPAAFNAVAAAGQLALGAGFLLRRTVRPAVAASVAWSVAVWWFGEGLGGLASGHASLLTGAPGAAALYGLLAIASWPHQQSANLTDDSDNPAGWLRWAWACLWTGGAALQALSTQNHPNAFAGQLRDNAAAAPTWIGTADRVTAGVIAHLGVGGLTLAVIVMAATGLGVLRPGRVGVITAYYGAGIALLMWVVGQNLGELYTGQATDPNSAVLLVVFAAAVVKAAPVHTHTTCRAPQTARPVLASFVRFDPQETAS